MEQLIETKEVLEMLMWFDCLSERKTEKAWLLSKQNDMFLLRGNNVIYELTEEALFSFFRSYGIKNKFVQILLDKNSDLLMTTGNFLLESDRQRFLVDNKTDAVPVEDFGRDVVFGGSIVAFVPDDWERVTLSALYEGLTIITDKVWNPEFSLEKGFQCVLFATSRKDEKTGTLAGVRVQIPVLDKVCLPDFQAAVWLPGCSSVCLSGCIVKKKKKNKSDVLEWSIKAMSNVLSDAQKLFECVESCSNEKIESGKHYRLFQTCAKIAHVPKKEMTSWLDTMFQKQNVFEVVKDLASRGKEEEGMKQLKALRAAGHLLSHGTICPGCCQEVETEEAADDE